MYEGEPELVLCGHACPFPAGEPCPLERGHERGHVYWTQTRPKAKRGRNGIWVVDEQGKTLMHATFDGAATAEEMFALMALREVAAKRMEQ
jgi:hypothetical protein